MEVDRIETSVGFTYLYSRRLTLYGKYMFREYDDREEDYLDGQFSMISVGMSWLF